MSAINIATQPPLTLNTLERALAWNFLTLAEVNPNKEYKEDDATMVRVLQVGIGKAGDDTIRLMMRASLILDPSYITSPDPLWMAVKEISDAQIPAAFLRQ